MFFLRPLFITLAFGCAFFVAATPTELTWDASYPAAVSNFDASPVSDGFYLYLVSPAQSNDIVRYRLLDPFLLHDTPWEKHTLLDESAKFFGGCFDGRYVYVSVQLTGGTSSRLYYFDTSKPFDSVSGPTGWGYTETPIASQACLSLGGQLYLAAYSGDDLEVWRCAGGPSCGGSSAAEPVRLTTTGGIRNVYLTQGPPSTSLYVTAEDGCIFRYATDWSFVAESFLLLKPGGATFRWQIMNLGGGLEKGGNLFWLATATDVDGMSVSLLLRYSHTSSPGFEWWARQYDLLPGANSLTLAADEERLFVGIPTGSYIRLDDFSLGSSSGPLAGVITRPFYARPCVFFVPSPYDVPNPMARACWSDPCGANAIVPGSLVLEGGAKLATTTAVVSWRDFSVPCGALAYQIQVATGGGPPWVSQGNTVAAPWEPITDIEVPLWADATPPAGAEAEVSVVMHVTVRVVYDGTAPMVAGAPMMAAFSQQRQVYYATSPWLGLEGITASDPQSALDHFEVGLPDGNLSEGMSASRVQQLHLHRERQLHGARQQLFGRLHQPAALVVVGPPVPTVPRAPMVLHAGPRGRPLAEGSASRWAQNRHGLYSSPALFPMAIATQPPTVSELRLWPYTGENNNFMARWAFAGSPDEVAYAGWALGVTESPVADWAAFQPFASSDSGAPGEYHTLTLAPGAAPLVEGTPYFMTVMVRNYAGLHTTRVEGPLRLDTTSPIADPGATVKYNSPVTVHCFAGSRYECYQGVAQTNVTWSGLHASCAPLDYFLVKLIQEAPPPTSDPATIRVAWSEGMATRCSLDGSRSDREVYHVQVDAFSQAGRSATIAGVAVLVQSEPPTCRGLLVPGLWALTNASATAYSAITSQVTFGFATGPGDPLDEPDIILAGITRIPPREAAPDDVWWHDISPATATPTATATAGLTGAPLTGPYTLRGLTLAPSPVPYYVTLWGKTHSGLSCYGWSNPLLVSDLPPLVARALVAVPKFVSTPEVPVSWVEGAFTDPNVGLYQVVWMVTSAAGPLANTSLPSEDFARGSATLSLLDPAQNNGTFTVTPRTQGPLHYLALSSLPLWVPWRGGAGQVNVTNMVRMWTLVSWPVLLETTPPIAWAAYLLGGSGDYLLSTSTLTAAWDPFRDALSDIARYQVCIMPGWGPLGTNGQTDPALEEDGAEGAANADPVSCSGNLSPPAAGPQPRHTFTGLALTQGSHYYLRVQGWNGAGGSALAHSRSFYVTVTAPLIVDISDGCPIGHEGGTHYQPTNDNLCLWWQYRVEDQADDPVVAVSYSVGTSPDQPADRIPVTSTGSIASEDTITVPNVGPWTNGGRYYTTLYVRQQSGQASNRTSAYGFQIDATPPAPVGPLHLTRYVGREQTAALSFAPWADVVGVRFYGYRIDGGPLSAPKPLLQWQLDPAGLAEGDHSLTLQATNMAYLNATQEATHPMTVVWYAPSVTGVWMGPHCPTEGHAYWQRTTDTIWVCWRSVVRVGGLANYTVTLYANHKQISSVTIDPAQLPASQPYQVALQGLGLADTTIVTAEVVATDYAGLTSQPTGGSSVNYTRIDMAKPLARLVHDGPSALVQRDIAPSTQVVATWSFTAPSGIRGYVARVLVGSCDGIGRYESDPTTNTTYWFPTSLVQYDRTSHEMLVVAVQATSNAGTPSDWFCSPGAVYGGTGPEGGLVRWLGAALTSDRTAGAGAPALDPALDGAFPPLDQLKLVAGGPHDTDRCLTVAWGDFAVPALNGAARYTVQVGRTRGASDILSQRPAGLRTEMTLCQLPAGVPMWATVCVWDWADRSACATTGYGVTWAINEPAPLEGVTGSLSDTGRPIGCIRSNHTAASADRVGGGEDWLCAGLTAPVEGALEGTLDPDNRTAVLQLSLGPSPAEFICAAQWEVSTALDMPAPDVVARQTVFFDWGAAGPRAALNVNIPLSGLPPASSTATRTLFLVVRTFTCAKREGRAVVVLSLTRHGPRPTGPLAVRVSAVAPRYDYDLVFTFPAYAAPAWVPVLRYRWMVADRTVNETGAPIGGLVMEGTLDPASASPAGAFEVRLPELDPPREDFHSGHTYLIQAVAESLAGPDTALGVLAKSVVFDSHDPVIARLVGWQQALRDEDLFDLAANRTATFEGLLCANATLYGRFSGLRTVRILWGTTPGRDDMGNWTRTYAAPSPLLPNRLTVCVGPFTMDNPQLRPDRRYYVSLWASNTLSRTASLVKEVQLVGLQGPGTVSVHHCAEWEGPAHDVPLTWGGRMDAQSQTARVCLRWAGFGAAPLIRVGRSPGEPLLTHQASGPEGEHVLVRDATESGPWLQDRDAYWLAATATMPGGGGLTRTAVSEGVVIDAQPPRPWLAEAQWVCVNRTATSPAMALLSPDCAAAEGRLGLVVFLVEQGTSPVALADIRVMVTRADGAPVGQSAADEEAVANPTEWSVNTPDRLYRWLSGPECDWANLECGVQYTANVTATNGLARTASVSSAVGPALRPVASATISQGHESGAHIVATQAVISPATAVDTQPVGFQWACAFARGQWWMAGEGRPLPLRCEYNATDPTNPDGPAPLVEWALGTRPNGTDILAWTPCQAALRQCVLGPERAGSLVADWSGYTLWIVARAYRVGDPSSASWAATSVRLERTQPTVGAAWIQCREDAVAGWQAVVGWQDLYDTESGMHNITVTLSRFGQGPAPSPAQQSLPEVFVTGDESPPTRSQFGWAIRRPVVTTPVEGVNLLCPYSATIRYCDRVGWCAEQQIGG
ncbi:hypothetical protein PAPYR_1475 [Paratrimastix pyriformis]|uniref:Uncharacterized protein n=1 Tax=Paratrimastix pyriformis TaxID=342808 RepID=A0ABQ8URQ7_9EUKA|nr:hypothetical protein PAPYR_1475 [Paratrimastix pyriformis]